MTEVIQRRLINERDLSEWLGVSLHTVRRWRYSIPPQGPPVRRVGRSIRYAVADVNEWIDESQDPYWRGE